VERHFEIAVASAWMQNQHQLEFLEEQGQRRQMIPRQRKETGGLPKNESNEMKQQRTLQGASLKQESTLPVLDPEPLGLWLLLL